MQEQLTTTDLGVQYAFLTPFAPTKLDIVNIEIIERGMQYDKSGIY